MDGSYDSYDARSPRGSGRERDREEYSAYRDSRRRSPDRRRDRRRSRSPARDIDRYHPADRLPRDDYRQRRRSSPQPVQAIDRYVPGRPDPTPPPQLLVNPMPDPMKLGYQVGFTWFAEWWRTEQRIKNPRRREQDRDSERQEIQKAYDQYKVDLQHSEAIAFVRQHKTEDWFRERYVSDVRTRFRQKLTDWRRGLCERWEQDLTGGELDGVSAEGLYKSDPNGVAMDAAVEKEEGETTGPPAGAEVLGVGDLLPSNSADLRDPTALMPTLLVKTIAPTVSRESFEQFAREHLGEEGDGAFRHLSLSDPNPGKRWHRMGWIILNPVDETVAEVKVEDGEEMEEGETFSKRAVTTQALENINSKSIPADPERGTGEFTVHVGIHRPPEAPRKKALWDLFSATERVARDLELATRLVRRLDNELGEDCFGVAKIEERVQHLADQGLLQPAEKPTTSAVKEENDDLEMEDGEEEEGVVEEAEDVDDEEMLIKKKKLDLLVEYLRRVYNFCFYCVFESDSVHELQRKCPGGHLRRPRSSLTTAAKDVARASANGEAFPLAKDGGNKPRRESSSANKNDMITNAAGEPMAFVDEDGELGAESPVEERKKHMPSVRNVQQLQRAFNWVKTFEEKLLQILEPDNVELVKLGGYADVQKGVEEDVGKYVKQEDTNKFRCRAPPTAPPPPAQTAASTNGQPSTVQPPEICSKLFRAPEFVTKHIEKRHPEFYASVREQIELVNRYVLDPARIAPSRSDAGSNGHFPLAQGGVSGTPRGFNLNNHLQPQMIMGGATMPGAAMFNPGMPGWNPAMGMPGGVGPVRTNNRGHMNGGYRQPHPYARPDQRGGRPMMPPMNAGRPVPGMGMEQGPPEAVAGRSLRSYEDLDAAGGREAQATAELDY